MNIGKQPDISDPVISRIEHTQYYLDTVTLETGNYKLHTNYLIL